MVLNIYENPLYRNKRRRKIKPVKSEKESIVTIRAYATKGRSKKSKQERIGQLKRIRDIPAIRNPTHERTSRTVKETGSPLENTLFQTEPHHVTF